MPAQFLSCALSLAPLDSLGDRVRLLSRGCDFGGLCGYPLKGIRVLGYHPDVKLASFDVILAVSSYIFQILKNVEKVLRLLIVVTNFLNCLSYNKIFGDFRPHVPILVLGW
jgi:hypothetical protein